MWFVDCQIQELIYDFFMYCNRNSISLNNVVDNDKSSLFQVYGVLNSLASIYYSKFPEDDPHDYYFDLYSNLGKSIGNQIRVATGFTYDLKDDITFNRDEI